MRDWWATVTFEYDLAKPQTARVKIQASTPANAGGRAVRKAITELNRDGNIGVYQSVVIVLEKSDPMSWKGAAG